VLPFVPKKDQQRSSLTSLQSYLASLPTPTALPTTLTSLTRVLLQYTAVRTSSSHLILGTSLTSLAVSLISGVAYGGGFHVKEEVQEEWSPDFRRDDSTTGKSVRVIRPLRDISAKECAVWAWWWKLRVVGREQWVWPGTKPGIGRLTKGLFSLRRYEIQCSRLIQHFASRLYQRS
jgi:cytoplasmic tRNA 2-thiolation protein 2